MKSHKEGNEVEVGEVSSHADEAWGHAGTLIAYRTDPLS